MFIQSFEIKLLRLKKKIYRITHNRTKDFPEIDISFPTGFISI